MSKEEKRRCARSSQIIRCPTNAAWPWATFGCYGWDCMFYTRDPWVLDQTSRSAKAMMMIKVVILGLLEEGRLLYHPRTISYICELSPTPSHRFDEPMLLHLTHSTSTNDSSTRLLPPCCESVMNVETFLLIALSLDTTQRSPIRYAQVSIRIAYAMSTDSAGPLPPSRSCDKLRLSAILAHKTRRLTCDHYGSACFSPSPYAG